MANPQKENGYTPIANELLDALALIRIKAEARAVFDVVLRMSYGWNKKHASISYRQFSERTGLSVAHVYRALKSLIKHNLIERQETAYGIQKNYNLWLTYSKQGYSKQGVSSLGVKPTPNREYALLQTGSRQRPSNPQQKPIASDLKHNTKDNKERLSLERLKFLWKNLLKGVPFPDDLPLEKIDFFLYKLDVGEIKNIKVPRAYIKALTIDVPFPSILEREEKNLNKEKAQRERFKKMDDEFLKVDFEGNKKRARDVITKLSEGLCLST